MFIQQIKNIILRQFTNILWYQLSNNSRDMINAFQSKLKKILLFKKADWTRGSICCMELDSTLKHWIVYGGTKKKIWSV